MALVGQSRALTCSGQVALPGQVGDTTENRCRSPLHTSQSMSSVFVNTPSASLSPAPQKVHSSVSHTGSDATQTSLVAALVLYQCEVPAHMSRDDCKSILRQSR